MEGTVTIMLCVWGPHSVGVYCRVHNIRYNYSPRKQKMWKAWITRILMQKKYIIFLLESSWIKMWETHVEVAIYGSNRFLQSCFTLSVETFMQCTFIGCIIIIFPFHWQLMLAQMCQSHPDGSRYISSSSLTKVLFDPPN